MERKRLAVILFMATLAYTLSAQNNDLLPEDNRQRNTPPEKFLVLPEYNEQGIISYLEIFNSDGYEGIWTIMNNETKIAIEKFQDPSLNSNFTHCLIFLSSPSVHLKKGTVIGYIERSIYQKMDYIWLCIKKGLLINRKFNRYYMMSNTEGIAEIYPNPTQRITKSNEFPITLIRDNPPPKGIKKDIKIL